MSDPNLIILKFGSSVLRSPRDLPRIISEIRRWTNRCADGTECRVIAVVSAFEGVTDRLLRRAARFGPDPDPHALAALVATGELTSAATLTLALRKARIASEMLDHHAIHLRTNGPPIGARAVSVDTQRLRAFLARAQVLVIPGFLGQCDESRTTLLERGGSDFTALYLAQQLGARCRLLKDTDGLYDADPAIFPNTAGRFSRVSWDDALALASSAVQPATVRYARDLGLQFEIARLGQMDPGTIVCRFTRYADAPSAARLLRDLDEPAAMSAHERTTSARCPSLASR